jgi:hypothetical protein
MHIGRVFLCPGEEKKAIFFESTGHEKTLWRLPKKV